MNDGIAALAFERKGGCLDPNMERLPSSGRVWCDAGRGAALNLLGRHVESAWHDVSRGTLEAVALEAYRDGTLSREQVGRVLGLSFWETEAFLKERQAYLAYDEQDLRDDLGDLGHLGSR